MRTALLLSMLATISTAVPLQAQTTTSTPASSRASAGLSVRPFAAVAIERFAADTTFDAIFGSATGALVGAGVLVTRRSLFVEAEVSRFRRDGERAFASEEDGYGVGIPLTVTVAPIEFAAGYRFQTRRFAIAPYVGGGLGIYRYREESSSGEPGEDVSASHAGWLVLAGAERRLHRYVAISADLRYTYVPGIIGQGGLSRAVGEGNLGGVAARFRVVLGP